MNPYLAKIFIEQYLTDEQRQSLHALIGGIPTLLERYDAIIVRLGRDMAEDAEAYANEDRS